MVRASRHRRREPSPPPSQVDGSERISIREVRDMMLSFQKMTKI